MIQWDTEPKFCMLSTLYNLKKTCHQNKWSSTHLKQSYLFLRRDVRLSEFNWCIKASLNVGSIDSTVIKRRKPNNKTCQRQQKQFHHKSILSSHSTGAIGCTSHCSTGKAGRTSRIGNPGSTQKCNNLCASHKLGHNAALTWPRGFTGSRCRCVLTSCIYMPPTPQKKICWKPTLQHFSQWEEKDLRFVLSNKNWRKVCYKWEKHSGKKSFTFRTMSDQLLHDGNRK